MPTNKPAAIAAFPPDRTNSFSATRHELLAAVARVRGSGVKKDDLDALLQWALNYNNSRNGE